MFNLLQICRYSIPAYTKQQSPIALNLYILAVLVFAQVFLLLFGSQQLFSHQLSSTIFAAAIGAIALIWINVNKSFDNIPIVYIFGLALVARFLSILAIPLLEDDFYRYLWDGLQLGTGNNPYIHAPSAFFDSSSLNDAWADILFSINYPHVPSVYGPILQLVFSLSYLISPGEIWPLKLILLFVDIIIFFILRRSGVSGRGLLIYACHPIILKEAMASAHPDIFIALFSVIALSAWAKNQKYLLGITLGLALATKLSVLVIIPFFLFKDKRLDWFLIVGLTSALTCLALYMPFLFSGATDIHALLYFAEFWEFNPLLSRLLLEFSEDRGKLVNTFVLLVLFSGLLISWIKNQTKIQPPIDLAFALLLLFSATVNPWYALWLIAPALYLHRYNLAIASSVLSLSYINGYVLSLGELTILSYLEPFEVPWVMTVVQIAVLIAALSIREKSCIKT